MEMNLDLIMPITNFSRSTEKFMNSKYHTKIENFQDKDQNVTVTLDLASMVNNDESMIIYKKEDLYTSDIVCPEIKPLNERELYEPENTKLCEINLEKADLSLSSDSELQNRFSSPRSPQQYSPQSSPSDSYEVIPIIQSHNSNPDCQDQIVYIDDVNNCYNQTHYNYSSFTKPLSYRIYQIDNDYYNQPFYNHINVHDQVMDDGDQCIEEMEFSWRQHSQPIQHYQMPPLQEPRDFSYLAMSNSLPMTTNQSYHFLHM
eukprot:TRINITY_DN700_c0_g1_i2.p1 TRINITY_DN700_c0_g1~~TRINITY_DN700_c0_g1_i2.p1  ORF type:complete len:259 (+),score=25.13 TRINITY_DN700_c0_g1_i2:347-1123(+)